MEYTANGVITLSPESRTRLSSDVSFVSPSKVSVGLSSESADKLSVLMKLEADNDTTAQELAQLELNRICNMLSFHNNIGISKSGISGMSCISTSKGVVNLSATVKVGTKVTAEVTVTLGQKSLSELVSYLQQDYPDDFEDVIFRWREAISSESSVLQYLLLYRLLELLFQSDTKVLTSWIIKKEPKVQLASDRKRGEITIYTALRDHIHPKGRVFPMKDIQANVGKLQTLVHQRIKEKYNIQ